MGDRLDSLSPEALDAETRRLRRLTRGLLYEQHDAEDAVQEAWLTVLRRDRKDPRSLSGWLTATVRRLASSTNRANARRGRRERAAAVSEHVPGAVHAVGRIEVLRRLLDALDSLEEPFRRTVALRFLDGLAPREIALMEGVPVETVRSRTRRGLARLRRALDTGDEERRRDFLCALAPLAVHAPWEGGTLPAPLGNWIGVLVVKNQVRLAALVAIVLLGTGGALWMVLSRGSAGNGRAPSSSVLVDPSTEAASPLEAADSVAQREPVAGPEPLAGRDWVVRGVVTDGNREALAGIQLLARLVAGHQGSGETLEEGGLVSDESGRFEWALEEPERLVTLSVDAVNEKGFTRHEPTTVPIGDEPPQNLLVRVFPLDVTLAGRVLGQDGAPVADARVSWSTYFRDETTRTDPAGRYRLRATSMLDTPRVHVVADGFQEARISVLLQGPGELSVEDIVLSSGRRLRGRLTDEDGAPVSGARVEAWATRIRTRSDAEGWFELTSLAPELKELWLRATETGLCDHARQVTAEELAAGEIEWVLGRGAAVRGTVLDEHGSPVGGAQIVLGYTPNSLPHVECWSLADGTFEFPAVQPNPAETSLWAGRDGFQWTSMPVNVPGSGESLEDLEMVLLGGHTMSGQVLDDTGKAVPWAWVYCPSLPRDRHVENRYADSEGRFRITGLAGGSVRLGFLKDGFLRHEESFSEVDRDGILVRLSPSGSLAGRVVDGLTGEPVPEFRVRFVEPLLGEDDRRMYGYGAIWASASGVAFTDPDGAWTTGGAIDLELGAVIGVRISAAGYAPTIIDRAVVQHDPNPDTLTARLYATSARIEGRVIDAEDGIPVQGATVRTFRTRRPRAGREEALIRTDELGQFALEGVPVGRTSLVVEHPERVSRADGPFDVPPSGSVHRVIELTRGSRLEGQLLDASGEPLAGEVVEVRVFRVERPDRNEWEGTTDSAGRFHFEGLKEGIYRVYWNRLERDLLISALSDLVSVDGVLTATVELRPLGRSTVRGRLGFEGEIPDAVRVNLQPWPNAGTDVSRHQGTVAIDGRFAFEHVQAGTYLVSVYHRRARGTEEVEVPEEGEVEVWIDVGAGNR